MLLRVKPNIGEALVTEADKVAVTKMGQLRLYKDGMMVGAMRSWDWILVMPERDGAVVIDRGPLKIAAAK